MSAIPAPRLVITSHRSEDGTSIISSDTQATMTHPFGPGTSGFTTLHGVTHVPTTSNNPSAAPFDFAAYSKNGIPRPPGSGGAIFCTTDLAPRSSARMHRTATVDYTVVLTGEVVMGLDGGEETVLKAGDTVVQQGTMHIWHNRTDEWARMLFVMVDAEKVTLADGRVLDQGLL